MKNKLEEIFTGHKNLALGKKIKGEDERIAICKGCKFYKGDVKRWCSKCVCNMPAKVKSPNSTCPEGFWETNEEE